MACRRRKISSLSSSETSTSNISSFRFSKRIFLLHSAALAAIFLASFGGTAQSQDQNNAPAEPPQVAAGNRVPILTIPAGTNVAMVLTQPVQSRVLHRGDDIYAQITAPVDSGNQVAIPPGTFVQGKLDKLERHGERGELRLQSVSITFPDGYVAPISGPATLESSDGYALRDPGPNRGATAVGMIAAGAGIGALIGHSAGSSTGTLTSSLPPGCTGAPPNCLTASVQTSGSKGIDTGIGLTVGAAIGGLASFAMLAHTRNFYLDVGSPVELTLQQPVTMQTDEVAKAVKDVGHHPLAQQPIAGRPVPPPYNSNNNGTCWTPGTPGTPPTVMPGAPGPDGIPGPPTVIPGTPPTPGTPYPCP